MKKLNVFNAYLSKHSDLVNIDYGNISALFIAISAYFFEENHLLYLFSTEQTFYGIFDHPDQ